MSSKEGDNSFSCILTVGNSPIDIERINKWRNILYDLKLIGEYVDRINFGSMSERNYDGFIMPCSKTGGIEKLTKENYVTVTEWNFFKKRVTCIGKAKVPYESLTHAAFYEICPEINSVIYINKLNLWNKLLNKVPTTSKKIKLGTPKMIPELLRLFEKTNVREKKIVVIGGNSERIIFFGKSPSEAGTVLLNYLT